MALDQLEPNDIFFQKILHYGMRDKTIQDVLLLEKKPATAKGENYLSYLTRFTLGYTCGVSDRPNEKNQKKVHLIMKEEPETSGETLRYIREGKIFHNERYILEEVVPKIEKLVGKKLGPKVYYFSNNPSVIVMEDLMTLGFQNKNRKVGFNEADVSIVLENMADFHAGSIYLEEQNPGCMSEIENGFIGPNLPEGFFTFIASGVKSIGAGVRDWQNGRFVSISDKLGKKSKEIIQELKVIYECDENELRTLNHGDIWMNNVMFKSDKNGKTQESCFVDYQMCAWTSPAFDLVYFLSISPELNLKLTHEDIFLKIYLKRLASTMKRLGCKARTLTLEELKKSMHKRRALALMAALVYYPKMIAEDDEVEPMDDIMTKGEALIDLLKNPLTKETMAKILPILDQRGYLD
ncbi:uncharacterized protein [Fopius arisanus]|nr:PREDICTED: uncharacterized protein LOC105266429 isoform X2 [Fopius arisanus]XP_011302883.1 PREDICTED: uncharacterized protein LOC105266429 isoform X2 [Fopius arisanus]KAG8362535.1 EcKinase 4 [Fopius arisanus]